MVYYIKDYVIDNEVRPLSQVQESPVIDPNLKLTYEQTIEQLEAWKEG